MSLILAVGIPIVGTIVGFQSKTQQKSTKEVMKAYSQSAGYAEQALSSIRVVQAFCNEQLELSIYVKYLSTVREQAAKTGTMLAVTGGLFGFIMTAFYAYTFFLGSVLRSN